MGIRVLLTAGKTSDIDAYAKRLAEAGAEPIEARPGDNVRRDFDALCLPGGPDVHWSRYARRWDGSESADNDRDSLELDELLPIAWHEHRPILAICRGLQVLNVFRGGTLVQDIGEEHRAKGSDIKPHSVALDPSSRLARLSGGTLLTVNSRHHQVLDRIGADLHPTALADGYIEAIEGPADTWVVGVQWHPERTSEVDAAAQRIFRAFVEAAEGVPAR